MTDPTPIPDAEEDANEAPGLVEVKNVCRQCGRERPIEIRKSGKLKGEMKAQYGWKQFRRSMLCPECSKVYYATRCANVPVHSVNVEFKTLEALILQQASLSTDAANFLLHEYELRDPWFNSVERMDPVILREMDPEEWDKRKTAWLDAARTRLAKELPKFAKPYMYKIVQEKFPQLAGTSVTCLEARVFSLYKNLRRNVIVNNTMPARVRYPYPILIRADAWSLDWIADEAGDRHPHVHIRNFGGTDVSFRLCDHPRDFGRQIAWLSGIERDEVKRGDLTLYMQEASPSEKNTIRMGEGIKRSFRKVMLSISVTFKNEAEANRLSQNAPLPDKILFVKTSPNILYAMTCDGHVLNTKHEAHVRRYILWHKERLQELADDRKGLNSNKRRRLLRYSRTASAKFDRRMNNVVFEHAKDIITTAKARRCGKVVVNDGPVKVTDDFRWFALWQRVENLCQQNGLAYEKISLAPTDPTESDAIVYANSKKEKERKEAAKELRAYKTAAKQKAYAEEVAQRQATAQVQTDLAAVESLTT